MKTAFILLAALSIATYWFWTPIAGTVAPIVASDDEINACATIVAIKEYRRKYDWKTKAWMPDARSEEDAIQSLIVDEGERPNMLARKASYERQFSIPTVYTKYVEDGAKLCMAKKLRGEKIEFPTLRVRDGYHITRWNGSAAMVKDGDQEPVFSCIDTYHPTGNGCVKN